MQCVSIKDKVEQTALLTHADKIKKIEEVFSGIRYMADIFLPDDEFYGQIITVEDPERMADILFKWLGIKHRSVQFHIDPNQEQLIVYSHKKNTSQISLGLPVLEDPLLCGAAVAHAIVHHLLIGRAKISLGDHDENEALADLGTIYAGFGVLILNSLDTVQVPLGSMAVANYASEFMDYCNEHRIVNSVWQPYVLPSVATEYLSSRSAIKKLKPFIRRRLITQRTKKRKLVLGLVMSGLIVIGISIFTLTRPTGLSPDLQEKRDAIAILRSQIEQCHNLVKYKQQKWDQSDIFIQRQIDADRTRCESLTSRYNYELNDYTSRL